MGTLSQDGHLIFSGLSRERHHMLLLKQNIISKGRTENPYEESKTWVAGHVCIFRAKFTQLGKSCISIGASPTMQIFIYTIQGPPLLFLDHHTAEIPGGTTDHQSSFSWAPFLFSFLGCLGILSLCMRISQVVLVVKNPSANAEDIRDLGSIPGWGRSPGGGYGNPL